MLINGILNPYVPEYYWVTKKNIFFTALVKIIYAYFWLIQYLAIVLPRSLDFIKTFLSNIYWVEGSYLYNKH